jgi:4-amino-4-deoxy-L-arabinose transferase-like glycosyltransferase
MDQIVSRCLLVVAAVLLLLAAQTLSYQDESFHLLAAAMVADGQVPYRDFFYQHPPLFPYFYALWLLLFGNSWFGAHVLSALLSTGTVGLVAAQVARAYPGSRSAVTALVLALLCLNPQFLWLGTAGHPYAMSMFFGMVSFRLLDSGMRNDSAMRVWLAGASAGAAVLSSFLVAPLLPVMGAWIVLGTGHKQRLLQFCRFAGGAALWVVPLLWLYLQAPVAFVFDLFTYQLRYRGPEYRIPPASALLSGLRLLVAWARSWEHVALSLLALRGLWVLLSSQHPQRATLALAAGLTAGLGLYLCIPYPAFPYYFVVLLPPLCMLAAERAHSR